MIFGNILGNQKQEVGSGGGNFERQHKLLGGAFGPLGVSIVISNRNCTAV